MSGAAPSRLGRFLFAGTLLYMAVDGFRNNAKRVEIARESGVPIPEVAVPFATGILLVASLGILAWRYPRASAGSLVLFFLSTTPVIHRFWEMDGAERTNNKINFCKNVALTGCAIVLFHEAAQDTRS